MNPKIAVDCNHNPQRVLIVEIFSNQWLLRHLKVAADCNQCFVLPVRAYNYVVRVAGKKTEQTVFYLPKFTIPDDKELVVEMNEKEGGRHQSFVVENSDLVRALTINELSVK